MTTPLMFLAGLALLLVGAELLVRGASRLAALAGISPLVIGLTVVAFGTSAPELAVSVRSALTGSGGNDVAIGNVVGSNIFNILLILGISSLITPLAVKSTLVRIDVPIMISCSVLVLVLARDGLLSRPEGGLLFAGIILYTVFSIRAGRKESREVREEYDRAFGSSTRSARPVVLNIALSLAGLAMLTGGAEWLVQAAMATARAYGVSELVIGVTIVAGGTSLPEVATSIVAAVRGERDIAVGNVVGSNIFNILAVLGASALASPSGVEVSAMALRTELPIMIAVSVVCLPVFLTGSRISRGEGAYFLLAYAGYIAYEIAVANHAELAFASGPALYAALAAWALLPLAALLRPRRVSET
jgi:cation:H+ antiporter